MARKKHPGRPKRVLRSVRWEHDVYLMLESKSEANGGFSALLNRIAAEWCGMEHKLDLNLQATGEALAKRVADEVISRIDERMFISQTFPPGRNGIDSRTLHEGTLSSHTTKNERDSDGRLWLDCPKEEKDEAKKRGAKWDADRVKWFVPSGVDEAPFVRWFPKGLTK